MIVSKLDSLLDLFRYVYALKKLERKGWRKKARIKCPETVAAHSYGVALITAILSDVLKCNSEKAVKMALLHDLAESVTGDLIPGELDESEKTRREVEAIRKIVLDLPPEIREEYLSLWEEYNEGISREAQIVRDADKLDMALQALNYSKESKDKESFREFVESALKEAKNGEIRKIIDKVLTCLEMEE